VRGTVYLATGFGRSEGPVRPDWAEMEATDSERTLAVTSDAAAAATSRQVISHLAVLEKERGEILTWTAAERYLCFLLPFPLPPSSP
jgi:hypothetical protein